LQVSFGIKPNFEFDRSATVDINCSLRGLDAVLHVTDNCIHRNAGIVREFQR